MYGWKPQLMHFSQRPLRKNMYLQILVKQYAILNSYVINLNVF